jgi:DME family drug/metabolite transporter
VSKARQDNIGALFVLGAAMLWGTTGTAQAFAPAGFDSTVIGFLRLAIGGVALLMLMAAQGELKQLFSLPLKAVLAAAACTAIYQVCFFTGVARTGVAIGTIVGIGSAPVFGGLLGFLFRKEHLNRRWYIATTLAIIGCLLLTLSSDAEVHVDMLGIALAIAAGAAYATYTLAIKGMLDNYPPTTIMTAVVCFGALILAPTIIGRDLAWVMQPRAILVVLHLGIMTMALSYFLFARGLLRVNVSAAVTLSLAEPFTAGTLGLLLLGEAVNMLSLSGIALIFSGLAFLALPARRAKGEMKPTST